MKPHMRVSTFACIAPGNRVRASRCRADRASGSAARPGLPWVSRVNLDWTLDGISVFCKQIYARPHFTSLCRILLCFGIGWIVVTGLSKCRSRQDDSTGSTQNRVLARTSSPPNCGFNLQMDTPLQPDQRC